MIISIVTDEISSDPETAIELANSWGVQDFELRGIGSNRVPFISRYQRDILEEVLEVTSSRIIAISPGLFKIPLPGAVRDRFPVACIDHGMYQKWEDADSLLQYHKNEILPASIEFAQQFGVATIVIFGFDRAGESPDAPIRDEVYNSLQFAAHATEGSDVKLALEVEEGFWGDTGQRTAEIIRCINHPNLGVNWDPGNSIMTGENPFPEGYAYIRNSLQHVHFKDVILQPDGQFQYSTKGAINWTGQLQALADDGYTGYISIETHMRPKVQAAKMALERLVELIEAVKDV